MTERDNLSVLGLSEQKIDETLRNTNLSNILIHITKEARKYGPISKSAGILLYKLGTKLSKQFHEHLDMLIMYVAKEQINHDAKLIAAINYIKLKYQPAIEIDSNDFEKHCGIGEEVTADEIENSISKIMAEYKEQIFSDRYSFNIGPLMGKVTSQLKWSDSKKVKEEFEIQMLAILGQKTDDDYSKLKGKKSKVVQSERSRHQDDKINCTAEPEKLMSMEEFLKTIKFHSPGDNFKTEGYVVTANTHNLLKQHLRETTGKVITRFPPEPNGILHIGHAKAININFGYASANNGICILRYDDTNPEKEEEKFFAEIKNMVQWLGYEPCRITHSSDYFDELYIWAKKLIELNLAYVCHQKAEELKGRDSPPSPWRNRPIKESLQLFKQMSIGIFDEGDATLRLKLTLEEGKVDPVAYRIKFLPHHRSNNKWCIYPTYDYTHCLCDSLENITHSLCTKEFQSRRSSYYWLCNALNIYCPVQWEYGRLNVNYTVVSKRKIKKLIDMKFVKDWDDPRLFTLSALKRRGVPAEAVNNFCATLGLTGAQTAIHPDALDHCVRDFLNTTAKRAMVTLEPLEVEIVNFPDESSGLISVPNIPGIDSSGKHDIYLNKIIFIENADFREIEEKSYRRLTLKQSVGLRHCGLIITVESVVHNECGKIVKINVQCHPATKENKPKAFIHWVSKPIKCEIRLYEKLFNHENPEDATIIPGGYVTDINETSIKVFRNALADISVKSAMPFDKFQFERVGFFSLDPDSSSELLIFNRTVSLKENKSKS